MSIIGPRPQTKRCFNAFSEEVRGDIIKVRPGLSGIGVLIIYNEERMMESHDEADRFYDDVIMTYKGALEQWYVRNNSVMLYFILIITTVVALFFKSSMFLFKLYPTLPIVPNALEAFIASDDHLKKD
jgi:lipopolysaccharide/colanic/teichoic acid biosynthesis glycosyltransferase